MYGYEIFRFILGALGIYLCLLALLYFFQNSLIYLPDQSTYTPQEAGVPEMRVIELTTSDNLKINAWYHPPQDSSRPTIVYFHGNAGNIANRGFIVRPFIDKGYGMLLLTYRGYSGNPGRPDEQGLYKDARAALHFIQNKGIPEQCIVLYGNSIGAAVAIQMATEQKVGAIVLQSPFSSLVDVAEIHYFFLWPFTGLIADKYDSLSKVDKITVPVFILHGKNDTIIPPELSRKLLEKLQGPKEAEYIPGRGHNDLIEPGLVDTFIKKHVRCHVTDPSSDSSP